MTQDTLHHKTVNVTRLLTTTKSMPDSSNASVQDEQQPTIALSHGDLFRRIFAVLLLVLVLATAIATSIDIEALLGFFPACCVAGVVLAFAVTGLRSWSAFGFAASAPLAVVVCSLTIAYGGYDPIDAQVPIALMWWLYTLLLPVAAWPGVRVIWAWRSRRDRAAPIRWQFQVKFLLIVMAVLSVLLTMLKSFEGGKRDFFVFACGSAGLILLVGFAFSLFWTRLRVPD